MSCFDYTSSSDFGPENVYVFGNETQVVSSPSYETFERTTVTPREIFYDFDEVMARMEAERVALMEDSDDFEESCYRCSETDSVDPMETSTGSSPPPSSITSSDSRTHSSFKLEKNRNKRFNNRNLSKKRPSNFNPNPCGSSPTPSTPPRSAVKRRSCGGKSLKPHRMRVRANAQHHRKFDLSKVDLTIPSLQCTYIHPIMTEQCRSRNEEPIDWTKTTHNWSHVVQEYRLMQRKALVIGEGTIITSAEMYRQLGNRVITCDLCGTVLSRKDVLTRHKARVHKIKREIDTGTGTEDGPSSSTL